jgi:uncharacterized protein (DUF2062 family)
MVLDKEKWKHRIKTILSLDSHPGHIAAGFAVGVFISFTPFFGAHTPLAIAVAFIFRLNKLTCITGAWVNTPITVVPALIASHNLGEFLLGRPKGVFTIKSLEWKALEANAGEILLGSSVIGFCAALLFYFICYYLVVRFRQRDETQAELAMEMEKTGEELD